MLIIIKSAPDTSEGRRAVKLARYGAGDIILIQNGVYFANKDMLGDFCGSLYVLEEDLKLRGVADIEKNAKIIGYGELIDMMAEDDKVVGTF